MTDTVDSIRRARALAAQFRLGQSVPAALEMSGFVSALARELTVRPGLADEFGQLLGAMLACQDKHDWLGLADYLEYELVAWLERTAA